MVDWDESSCPGMERGEMIGMMTGSREVVGKVGLMSGAWGGPGSKTPIISAPSVPEEA